MPHHPLVFAVAHPVLIRFVPADAAIVWLHPWSKIPLSESTGQCHCFQSLSEYPWLAQTRHCLYIPKSMAAFSWFAAHAVTVWPNAENAQALPDRVAQAS
ncbi:hypothetical protein D3C80_549610 [compost metagenome]